MTPAALAATDPLVLTGIVRVVAHAARDLLHRYPPLGLLAGAGPILLIYLGWRTTARCRRRWPQHRGQ